MLKALTELERLVWQWRTTGKVPNFLALTDADDEARAALALAKGK